MAAMIQRAESQSSFRDPESATKTPGKRVGISEKDASPNSRDDSIDSIDGGSMKPTHDHTHRTLKSRHLQLIGIGGTIGTALYVQIGSGLRESGPGSLFLGFGIWYVLDLDLNTPSASIQSDSWVVPTSSMAIMKKNECIDNRLDSQQTTFRQNSTTNASAPTLNAID